MALAGEQTGPASRRRRVASIGWAVLLSLASPGLGQVYARLWRRGLSIAAALFVVAIVLIEITRTSKPSQVPVLAAMFFALAGLVFYFWAAFDAGLQARRRPDRLRARWFKSAWLTALWVSGVGWIIREELPVKWQTFSIPSVSMAPTVRAGDYLVMAKTGTAIDARHGDVVVFVTPQKGDAYLKRVIGVSGDLIAIQKGQVVLNDVALPLRDDGTVSIAEGGRDFLVRRFVETMPDGRNYAVARTASAGPANNMPGFLVRPGMVFVMGDNRDNSLDSRFAGEFREIPAANLVGKGGVIFWSRDLTRLFTSLD